MISLKDQLGTHFDFIQTPQKIISIVPSQTELLYDLGIENEIIGITKFCTHPEKWRSSKTIIGGTKNLDLEKIKKLKPDLIIANKEENSQEQIITLQQYFPVWVSDIHTLNDALDMILSLGAILNKKQKSLDIAFEIQEGFDTLTLNKSDLKVAYCIWRDPWMWAGGGCFIGDMLKKSGLTNLFEKEDRYPIFDLENLKKINPDIILLSSEPFPFKIKDVDFLKKLFPTTKILWVDGTYFSWYGSRLLKAPRYFKELSKQMI